MSFRITARTLLELGSELISSDAIALFELIKNGVDAGSPVIKIKVQSVLTHSHYQQALEYIDEDVDLELIKTDLKNCFVGDAPSQATKKFHDLLDKAGSSRDNLRNALVAGYCEQNFIQIEDEGEGMSSDDLQDVYLTIGTRSRRREKLNWQKGDQQPKRILLGDKGVGRLSVMRLGDKLDVITSTKGERFWNCLSIDWRQFSHESDALLHEIPVTTQKGSIKEDKQKSGTTIRITNIKGDWDKNRFSDLLNTDFVRMVDPFDRWKANKLFRIYYNDQQVTLPKIEKRLFELAHALVNFRYHYDDKGRPKISGEMQYRLHANKTRSVSIGDTQLTSITDSKSAKILRALGDFDVEFIWFNRKYLTALEGIGTRRDVIDLVNKWAGGLMVFRDGFRINPYGGPDDDWLHLDKKAFSRRGYKLNRNQIIGRVRLSWRNNFLVEQTNREGLVDNAYKDALIKILQHVLEDFKRFSQGVEDELKREELTSLDTLKQRAIEAKNKVQKKIREIAIQVPEQAGPLQEVERLVGLLARQIDGAEDIIDDYKTEREKFVQLASLGLMVELILHELGRASGNTLGTLAGINMKSLPGKLPAIFETLETQLKTLQKRIETLDPLSTARRQIKETFDLFDVIQQVVDARAAQAKRHRVNVHIVTHFDGGWRIKAVKGMIIQIIENLLANSFYWLKHKALIRPGFRPQITITLDKIANIITVTDNGPGVEPERADEIFLPFVTSKPPGKGSGLGLYISRELATYHNWALDIQRTPSIARKSLDTFVLDFSGEKK